MRERGWAGKRNGELLRLAAPVFDVLLTMDRGIEYQQNLPAFASAVILIEARSNRRGDVEPAMGEVNRLPALVSPGHLYRVKAHSGRFLSRPPHTPVRTGPHGAVHRSGFNQAPIQEEGVEGAVGRRGVDGVF